MSRRDNSLAGAQRLGQLLGRNVRRVNSVGTLDRVDFYQFTLSQAADFSAALQVGRGASFNLLNRTGRPIARGGANRIVRNLAAGTYYLQVNTTFRGNRPVRNARYVLSASALPPEPGETPGTGRNLGFLPGAIGVSGSIGSTDDKDFYRFSLNQISDFSATLTGLSQSATLRLYTDNGNGVVDGGDIQVISDFGGANDNANIATPLPAGTYFVELDYGDFSGATAYQLQLTQTPAPGNVSPEPSATNPVPVFGNATLVDLVGNLDETDYYKLSLSQITDITATLSGLGRPANLALYIDNGNGLLDSNDRRFASDFTQVGENGNLSLTMPQGTYFVGVEDSSFSSGNTRYTLGVTQTPRPGNVSPDPSAVAPLVVGSFPITLSDLVGDADETDYYRLAIGQTRTLTATLQNITRSTSIRLYRDNGNGVKDDNDTRLATDFARAGEVGALSRALDPGTYLIEIEDSEFGSNNTRYDLSLGIG